MKFPFPPARLLGTLAIFALGFIVPTAHAVLITFDDDGDQVTSNFRFGQGSDPIENNNYLEWASTGLAVVVYDADGSAGAGVSLFSVDQSNILDIKADIAMSTSGSFGFLITDGGTTSNAYLAIFNVNNGATLDQIRFFSGARTDNATSGTSHLDTTADSGVNTSTTVFSHYELVYGINASNQPVLTFTVGTFSQSLALPIFDAHASVQVGLRYNGSGTLRVDNFSIQSLPVPEPGSPTLIAGFLAALPFLVRRKRVSGFSLRICSL